ncbi:Domain of unknown function DUF4219 [Plasmopara halstedii]|uniref:Uncharacterized protein n=1 Tax=Plasmopara halstedii TaxID=4781 RepID=A0A0P1AI89_PLAHL|nr:Domain of unknown function DUF4219 [Plasmopara halstedii]CEG40722.1 Domain of unknown function DUF4219 [Plasmopara halstedii]|eukprot:XP_024577091.1 Domain of unknown function DUF4219 [Plasmopara halstedii]
MSPSSMDKVGKFDGTGFQMWAYKMRMFLTAKSLWRYVDGTATENTEKSSQAIANIALRLEDSQLIHVMNATTARNVACFECNESAEGHVKQDVGQGEICDIPIQFGQHDQAS